MSSLYSSLKITQQLPNLKSFESLLRTVNDDTFASIALELFQIQAQANAVYRSFLDARGLAPSAVRNVSDIPFMPISFFKTKRVVTGEWQPEQVFTSSGTTGSITSSHYVQSLAFYLEHATRLFECAFGSPANYHLLALLPGYAEREGSSLLAMVEHLIRQTKSPFSGYYLRNQVDLLRQVDRVRQMNDGRKVLIWGVTFSLLELAEQHAPNLADCLIIETGGMKGRRPELTRAELHEVLSTAFGVRQVASEYGMTELLSQAYSEGAGRFSVPPCMKIRIRDINDPKAVVSAGKTGLIQVIDLANIHSCAFIETEDLGLLSQDGYFQVLGRMDNSDARGCNLLVG